MTTLSAPTSSIESAVAAHPAPVVNASPTIFGLNPTQLHDRFWAARGVQVVRQGEPSEIVDSAELFLLTDPRTLAIFKIRQMVDTLSWIRPDLLFIRLHDERERGYREHVLSGADDRFIRLERIYGGLDSRLARVALTPERRLAQLWQNAPDAHAGWRRLRQEIPRAHRAITSCAGTVYDRAADAEVMQFIRDLQRGWKHPDSTVTRARQVRSGVWADDAAKVDPAITLIGPVWIGAGRTLGPSSISPTQTAAPTRSAPCIVGPQVLWDDPAARPPVENLQWQEIEPRISFENPVKPATQTSFFRVTKRLFDIAFALVAILITLPVYPLVFLAIWLEDGWPFFFRHKRESMGGREFLCVKFRSMRKDADQIQAQLAAQNQADGPQFFISEDPRLTRVGRFIRRTYIDELPQFFNILLGDMSVVGPRPSPFKENQYCPPWREARLSVRPGLTGLWQVKRTRRRGLDFQEWIKYDILYVENVSWSMDLKIIWDTIWLVIRGVVRS